MKKTALMGLMLVMLAAATLPSFAETVEEKTWVHVIGAVQTYGETPIMGWLGAHAKVGEWAMVHVAWASLPLEFPPMLPNYTMTFSFYGATLVNSTTVELNYTGYDLYVAGLWDAYSATFVWDSEGNCSWTLEQIVDDASGELRVMGNWTDFEVDITSLDLIGGTVTHYLGRPIPIPIGDCNMDSEVNILDLVHIAKAYGEMPGRPEGCYSWEIDFNFDFVIDIGDLTTIAANLGEEY